MTVLREIARAAAEAAEAASGLKAGTIMGEAQSRHAAQARRLAILATRERAEALDLYRSTTVLGQAFGVHHTTILYALSRVDCDDPRLAAIRRALQGIGAPRPAAAAATGGAPGGGAAGGGAAGGTAGGSRPPPEPLSALDLQLWTQTAEPGARIVYARGERATEGGVELARAARQLMAAGALHLVQRRIGPGCFDYEAVRRGGAS